jgi:hypothetical protein
MSTVNSIVATVGAIGAGGIVAGLLLPVIQRSAIHIRWEWFTPLPPVEPVQISDGLEALEAMRDSL